jgi:hypothetical protein
MNFFVQKYEVQEQNTKGSSHAGKIYVPNQYQIRGMTSGQFKVILSSNERTDYESCYTDWIEHEVSEQNHESLDEKLKKLVGAFENYIGRVCTVLGARDRMEAAIVFAEKDLKDYVSFGPNIRKDFRRGASSAVLAGLSGDVDPGSLATRFVTGWMASIGERGVYAIQGKAELAYRCSIQQGFRFKR